MAVTVENLEIRVQSSSTDASKNVDKLGESIEKASKGFKEFKDSITSAVSSVIKITKKIGELVEKSNDYEETLNFFRVAMKDYYEDALDYATRVENALGIDSTQWMQYQATFQNMSEGFGIGAENAEIMSRNLTQMGYDLASVFNLDFDKSMKKMESALSGQSRAVRDFGVDISQAALEELALSMGIEKNVQNMTQAEKAQLRYIQLFNTINGLGLSGDFQRTIESPANALRVLASNAQIAARELGNMFIPVLNKILPYATAVVKTVRWVASEIASFLGFKMTDIDYSGLTGTSAGFDSVGESADNAAGAVQDFKNSVLGIDEINALNDNSSGGSGGSGGSTGGLDFDLSGYDNTNWLDENLSLKADKIFEGWKKSLEPVLDWIKENFESILDLAKLIGITMLAWKVTKSVASFIEDFRSIKSAVKGLSKGLKFTGSVILSIAGYALEYQGMYDIGKGNAGLLDYIKTAVGTSLGVGMGVKALTLVGASTGVGLAITVPIALMIGFVAYFQGKEAALREIRKEMALDQFWNSLTDGGVAAEEYFGKMTAAMEKLGASFEIINSYGEKIKEIDSTVGEAQNTVSNYMAIWEATGTLTKEQIGGMIDALSNLVTASQEKLSLSADILTTTFAQAMENADEKSKELYGGLIGITALLEANGNTALVGYQTELINAKTELANLDETSDTYAEDSARLMQEISDITVAMLGFGDSSSDVTSEMSTMSDKIKEIDFSSVEDGASDAAMFLGDFEQATVDAYDNASTSYQNTMDAIDYFFSDVDTKSPGWKAIYQNALDFGMDSSILEDDVEGVRQWMEGYVEQIYKDNVAQIDRLYNETIDTLGTSMNEAVSFAASIAAGDAEKDWADRYSQAWYGMSWPEILATGNEQAIQEIRKATREVYNEAYDEAIEDMLADGNVKILAETLESTFSDIEDAKKKAKAAGVEMGNALVGGETEGLTDPVAKGFMDAGFTTLAGIIERVSMEAIDAHSPAKLTIPEGEYLTAGIAKGLTDDTAKKTLKTSIDSLSTYIPKTIEDTMKLNTPHSVLKKNGKSIVSDIADGISGNTSVLSDSIGNMFNVLLGKLDTFTYRFKTAVNTMLYNWKNAMNSVTINSSTGKMNYSSMASLTIPRFAAGGFADQGQLFIAREAGPELVGTMGGRTAVANNDQIVAGIAAGVSSANSEQSSLLREQNNLLRQLLSKDATVQAVITAGSITEGLSRQNRRTGRTIVPVGAY